METKSLQELNDEYARLANDVKEIQKRLEEAQKAKDKADREFSQAESKYQSLKKEYESKNQAYKKLPKDSFSQSALAPLMQELTDARQRMEEAKKEAESKQKANEQAESAFNSIQQEAQTANDRMDLILVSFGADKRINTALNNEIENDYDDKIDEIKRKQQEVENLKTKISNDSEVKSNVEELQRLLDEYNRKMKELTNQNSGDTSKIAARLDEIKTILGQLDAQREKIKKSLTKLGVKGDAISSEAIDEMTTKRDSHGRIIISELDEEYSSLGNQVQALTAERSNARSLMAETMTMVQNIPASIAEYEQLGKDIIALNEGISSAEKQKNASAKRLDEIQAEREALRSKLATIQATNPNSQRITELQNDINKIKAEPVEMIDNPERALIQTQINAINDQIRNGHNNPSGAGDHPQAAQDVQKAEEALEALYTTYQNINDNDDKTENPRSVSLRKEIEVLESDREKKIEKLKDLSPELAELYAGLEAKEKELAQLDEDIRQAEQIQAQKYDVVTKEYVNEEIFADLGDKNSEASKSFENYRMAELNLRKAMIDYQKNPTAQSRLILDEAIKKYNESANNFSKELHCSNGSKGTPPSIEAMHNYLLNVLRTEAEAGKKLDAAYNLDSVAYGIRVIEHKMKGKQKPKQPIIDLKASVERLDGVLDKILLGKPVKSEESQAIDKHAEILKSKTLKQILANPDAAMDQEKVGFLRGLFSFGIPKQKTKYAFTKSKNTPPKSFEEFEVASEEVRKVTEIKDGKSIELSAARIEAETILVETAKNNGLESELETIHNDLTNKIAEEQRIPKYISKKELERLTQELNDANARLTLLRSVGATIDLTRLKADRDELIKKLRELDAQVESPDKQADKQRRIQEKQAEINRLAGAQIDTSNVDRRMRELDAEETSERTKRDDATMLQNQKNEELNRKTARFKLLERILGKMRNLKDLIQIRDAGKFSDRRYGNIADALAQSTKNWIEGEER